jgi:hypothetical protein
MPFSKKEKSEKELFLNLLGLYALNMGNCANGIWARNIETNQPNCIPATQVAVGKYTNIYKEDGLSVKMDFAKLANEFDTNIYPSLSATFGLPSDINQDGKIDIFILDIRDGATANAPFVAGFFDPNDLPSSTGGSSRSNNREIIYMDGKELLGILYKDPKAFESTVAHEFQHLIRYPKMQKVGFFDDVWINEGTSEVASDLAGYGSQTSRISCFHGSAQSPCNQGGNGVSLLDWTTGSSGDSSYVLKQYSYAYLFVRYLYENAGLSENTKKSFFYNTVNGNNSGIRGDQVLGMIQLFRDSNSNDPILGGSNQEAFQLLLNSFWVQMVSGSTANPIIRSGNPSSNLDLSPLATKYPIPSDMVAQNPNPFPILSDIPSTVRASAGVRVSNAINVNATVSAITTSDRITSISNPSTYILLYGESNRRSSLIKSLLNDNIDSQVSLKGSSNLGGKWKSWNQTFIKDGSMIHNHPLPICGHPFLKE